MRKVLIITTMLVSLLLLAIVSSSSAEAARVKGYYNKRNGTYVEPYYRTNPNSYKWDNYSSQGNINPYNGRRGYRRW